jgi:hypothetical protein
MVGLMSDVEDGDRAGKTIGQIQVAGSMGLKCTSQVEEHRGREKLWLA